MSRENLEYVCELESWSKEWQEKSREKMLDCLTLSNILSEIIDSAQDIKQDDQCNMAWVIRKKKNPV